MCWAVETLNKTVDREFEALPTDQRAKFLRIAELIEAKGLERVREPYVRHLDGPLWEIRMKGRDGISRALMWRPMAAGSLWFGTTSRKPKRRPAEKLDLPWNGRRRCYDQHRDSEDKMEKRPRLPG